MRLNKDNFLLTLWWLNQKQNSYQHLLALKNTDQMRILKIFFIFKFLFLYHLNNAEYCILPYHVRLEIESMHGLN